MKKTYLLFALSCALYASDAMATNAMRNGSAENYPDDVIGNNQNRPTAEWTWPWDRKDWGYTSPSQVVDNIPTLYITTNSGSDPTDKENYLPCTIEWVEGGKVVNRYELGSDGGGIRGRGNSTWGAVKKPWRIKFDKKQKFLGDDYANAKSWTLLANSFDKTLMRNALTYHIGKFVGMEFSPCYKFVNLVMNGTYRGTYQISDQVEVKKKRVFVENEDTDWLLEYGNDNGKVDQPKVDFRIDGKTVGWVQVKNPEFENDDLNANPTLAAEIQNYLNSTIASRLSLAKTGYTYLDPRNGYRAEVDTTSLINWYIAQEITWNWDAYYSIYMYRAANGLLHFGPLWDNDLAYGGNTEQYPKKNKNYNDQKLLAFSNWKDADAGDYRKMQPYIGHMFDDPWFANAVKMRFDELIAAGLENFLLGKVDMLKSELAKSAEMNFDRWRIYDYPYADDQHNKNPDFRSYVNMSLLNDWDDYVKELREFISERLSTLKTEFANRTNGTKGSKVWYFYEQQQNTVPSGTSNVVMRRPFVSGTWNTMCLPFDLTSDEINYLFGEGTIVEAFMGISKQGNAVTFKFHKVSKTVAGTPYLVMPAKDVTVPFAFLNKTFASTAQSVNFDGCTFVGTYSPVQLKGDGTQLFVSSGNKLTTPSASSSKLKGLRAYFDLDASVSASVKKIAFDYDEEAMGIDEISVEKTSSDSKIYNLNGQYVGTDRSQLPRGIYIIGGKKVMVK